MHKFLAAGVAAAFLAGCGSAGLQAPKAALQAPKAAQALSKNTDNFGPRIHYILVDGMMGSSFSAPPNWMLRFEAYAVGDGMLDFNWRGFGFLNGFGNRATWMTPSFPGTYTVDLTVRDRTGRSDWRTVWIDVRPRAEKLERVTLTDAQKAGAKGAEAKPAPDAK